MRNLATKFLHAEDMTDYPFVCNGGSAACGFNRRIAGETYRECFRYPHEQQDRHLHAGWQLADKLIDEGKIYFIHNFHSIECRSGHAFQYGGAWVCNTCGRSNIDTDKWKIRIFKDGDKYCCVGLEFKNLQESDNFGFGETRDVAIENYWRSVQ